MTYIQQDDWLQVDGAGDPNAMLSYLDSARGLANIMEYKKQSFELLELAPGGTALDVGCGTGDDARVLAAGVGPTGRVIGVDSSETAIGEAIKRSGDSTVPVEFQVGNAHELDLRSDQFGGTS